MRKTLSFILLSSIFVSSCSSQKITSQSVGSTIATTMILGGLGTFPSEDDKKTDKSSYSSDKNQSYGLIAGGILLHYLLGKNKDIAIKRETGTTSNTHYKGSIETAKAQIAVNEKELNSRIKIVDGKKILNFNNYPIVDQKPIAFNRKDAQSVNALKSDDLLMFDLAFWNTTIKKDISTPNIDKNKQKKLIQKELNKRHNNIDWELYRSVAIVGGSIVAGTLAIQSLKSGDSAPESPEEKKGWSIIKDERDSNFKQNKKIQIKCKRKDISPWILYRPEKSKPYVTGVLYTDFYSTLSGAAKDACGINFWTK